MNSSHSDHDMIMARFLLPRYALKDDKQGIWLVSGVAETPGEDAVCRIFVRHDAASTLQARFSAHGPPAVIASADWLCERVSGDTEDRAREITAREVEKALALPAVQRYAGLVACDALANALFNSRS